MLNVERLISLLLKECHPQRLLPSLTIGLVVGILEIIFAISLAALIFSEPLSEYLSVGISLALFTVVMVNIAIAFLSSLPGIVANVQESPAALLAVVAHTIAVKMAASSSAEVTVLTVIVVISLTSILTGMLFFALGWFQLGGLVRFIPYPVVGGFLAGTGWLLACSSISMMADFPLNLSQLPKLMAPDIVIKWLPGLLFALLLLGVLRHCHHFLVIPGLLLGGIVLFYLVLQVMGIPVHQASTHGLLLDAFPQGNLWQPINVSAWTHANWQVIITQLGSLIPIVLVSAITLLCNASGIEVAVNRELDFNHELQAAGIANVVAGLGGGIIGFQGLALSTLTHKIGAKSRLVGVFVSALGVITLCWGGSVLSFVPKFVLGGLLLFLGLDFLMQWVYQSWFKLPKTDYLIIILILVVIATAGFLEGVSIGLLLAVILFVVSYSQIDATRTILSGANYHSNVARLPQEERSLREQGQQIAILELQGFIFFGTANNLFNSIRQFLRLPRQQPLRFLVLDFRLVSGIDSSAVFSFTKIKQLAKKYQVSLVFTTFQTRVEKLLLQGECWDAQDSIPPIFPDLDRGLEWCENQILQILTYQDESFLPLIQQLEKLFSNTDLAEQFISYLEPLSLPAGSVIFRQGEPADGIYFVQSGQISVWLELPDSQNKRLRTFHGGTIFGEIGFYTQECHSASVVSDQPSYLYYLSPKALAKMETEVPLLVLTFQKLLISRLAEHLKHTQEEFQSLL